jgi:hypothetical protein
LRDGLDLRWTMAPSEMTEAEFGRCFVHPERGPMRLDLVTAMYGWRSRHHVAHITGLTKRMGW